MLDAREDVPGRGAGRVAEAVQRVPGRVELLATETQVALEVGERVPAGRVQQEVLEAAPEVRGVRLVDRAPQLHMHNGSRRLQWHRRNKKGKKNKELDLAL